MGGGLMQLVAYGAQDIYLTGNPQITFFKAIYSRHTNFAIESIEQSYNGVSEFGGSISCTISRNGDLLSQIYLECIIEDTSVDRFFSSIKGGTTINSTRRSWPVRMGYQIIDYTAIEIGGQCIDKHYGDWMDIWAQLSMTESQYTKLNRLISGELIYKSTENKYMLYIPMQFWFCKNPGLALPLIALQYHEVKLKVKFSKGITRTNITDSIVSINDSSEADIYRRFELLAVSFLEYAKAISEEIIDFTRIDKSKKNWDKYLNALNTLLDLNGRLIHTKILEALTIVKKLMDSWYSGRTSFPPTTNTGTALGTINISITTYSACKTKIKNLLYTEKGIYYSKVLSLWILVHDLNNLVDSLANYGMQIRDVYMDAVENNSRQWVHSLIIYRLLINSKEKDPKAKAGNVTNILDSNFKLNNCSIYCDYIFLDTDERRRFAQVSHEYLIEQVQSLREINTVSSHSVSTSLKFNHPVKEMFWTIRRSNFGIFNYFNNCWNSALTNEEYPKLWSWEESRPVDMVNTAQLQLNGKDRMSKRRGSYFRSVQAYQHHTGGGRQNISTDKQLGGIYCYSFAIKPEDHQPSGTCNFSRIDNAVLNLDTSADGILNIYAINYNVLRIMSGMGGLAYSN